MTIELSYAGKVALLQNKVPYLNTLEIHLYKNDVTPDGATVVSDFVEADFTGYSAQNTDHWSAAFLNGDLIAQTSDTAHVFTQSGTGTICDVYGYYLTTAGGALLVLSERDPDGPVAMDTTSKTYSVLLSLLDDTLVP